MTLEQLQQLQPSLFLAAMSEAPALESLAPQKRRRRHKDKNAVFAHPLYKT